MPMHLWTEIGRSHPNAGARPWDPLAACAEACNACELACLACADACLYEADPRTLRACISLNLACAAVCGATQRLASRPGAAGPVLEAQLRVTLEAARACAAECAKHAAAHEHCLVCRDVCERCVAACQLVLRRDFAAPAH